MRTVAAAMALMLLSGIQAAAQSQRGAGTQKKVPTAQVVISQKLPAMDGSHLRIIVEQVNFPPDAGAPAHTHPCPVVGYVTEGAFQSQVAGGKLETYSAGQAFYEPPHGVHQVARDKSHSRPAQILAIFICDRDEPLTMPVAAAPRNK